MNPKSVLWMAALAMVPCAPIAQAASAFPDRPVRLVVPYPPGGASDVLARILGRRLGETIGQRVIIDNRPGSGTVIGTQIVAAANPDGHTLLITSTPMGTNPALYARLPYDTVRDFSPVAFVGYAPVVMVAHPSVPVRTPQELIAAASAKPRAYSVATPGPGSLGHLILELLNRQAGISLQHIPYKGAGQAAIDVIAGHVGFLFDNVGPARVHIQAGRTRAIGVTSLTRIAALPDVPTFHESGVKALDAKSWYALFAPARTSGKIVDLLNAQVNAAVASPEFKELFARDSYEAEPMTPEQVGRFVRLQIDKWTPVIRDAGIKVE